MYDISLQGGRQYGNITNVTNYEYVQTPYYSGYSPYTQTITRFYPKTIGDYLVGYPAYQNQFNYRGGVADETTLLSSTIYLYDDHPYTQSPSNGKLTGKRTFLRFAGTYTDHRYLDEAYGYDAWGNRTTTTVYTQEGTLNTRATSVAQTTTTCYGTLGGTTTSPVCSEDGYGTYPGWTKNASNQPVHPVTQWVYDKALWVPTQETDANNVNTYAAYDGFGRLRKIWRPGDDPSGQPTLEIIYDDLARPYQVDLIQKIDGAISTHLRKLYDGLGRQIRQETIGATLTGTADIVVGFTYNADGKVTRQTVPYTRTDWIATPNPVGTETEYDALGRPVTVHSPDGVSDAHYEYDGLVTRTYDAKAAYPGNTYTETLTDAWGQVIRVMPVVNGNGQSHGLTTYYAYDLLGRLINVNQGGDDAAHWQTSIEYDAAGRKTEMSDIDMGHWLYTYDALGNLITQTDARTCTTTLTYDILNRVTNKTYGGPNTGNTLCDSTADVSYGYDEEYDNGTDLISQIGYRTSMSDGSGSTAWRYDARGRMIQEVRSMDSGDPNNDWKFKTLWDYYSNDAMMTMTYPADHSGNAGEVVGYSYHPQGVVSSVTSNEGNAFQYVSSITYDEASRVLNMNAGSGTQSLLLAKYTYYSWDTDVNGGRLSTIQAGPSYSFLSLSYNSYDANGNIVTLHDDTANEDFTYDYDDLNRLISVSGTIAESYTYVSKGRLSSKNGVTLNYDANTQAHAVRSTSDGHVYSYDANGNMVQDNAWTYVYNGEGQLIQIKENGVLKGTYTYDGDGNRVKSIEDDKTTVYIGNYYEEEMTAVTNLMADPGFEGSSWTLAPSSSFPGTSVYNSTWGSAAPQSGTKAVSISNHVLGYIHSNVIQPVAAGEQYDLTAYVRGELDGEGSLGCWLARVKFYNSSDAEVGAKDIWGCPGTLSTSWQEIDQANDGTIDSDGRFTVVSNATKMQVMLYVDNSTGWIAFDDVSVKKVGTSTELITDPGFETGSWTPGINGSFPATSVARGSSGIFAPRSGSYAYAISNLAYGRIYSNLMQPVAAGEQYDVSAYIKGELDSEDSAGCWIARMYFYDSGGSQLSTSVDAVSACNGSISGTGWRTLDQANDGNVDGDGRITVPSGAASMRLYLFNYNNSGWLAFDDVSVKKVGSSTNLISDPGFENNGWTSVPYAAYPATSYFRSTWGTAAPRSGSYAYVISNQAYGYIKSNFIENITPGQVYDVGVYVRGEMDGDDTGGCLYMRVEYYRADGSLLTSEDPVVKCNGELIQSMSWQQVRGQVIVPDQAVKMRIQLFSTFLSGWVAFDNVEVKYVPVRKYYYAGSQRIAVRSGMGTGQLGLSFLLSDHLGSARKEVRWDKTSYKVKSEMRYKAFGESRAASGQLTTDRKYTGQIEELGGIYFYNARWYSPSLGRFLQADSIIPGAGNPLAWDRYAYGLNNPSRYTDPSGHFSDDAIIAYLKQTYTKNWESYWKNWQKDSSWMNLLHEAKAGDILTRLMKSGDDYTLSYYQFVGKGNDLLTGLYEIADPGANPTKLRESSLGAIYSSSHGLGVIRINPGQDPMVVGIYGNIGITGDKTSLGDVRMRNVALNASGWATGMTFEKWWAVGLIISAAQGMASPEISNFPGFQEGDYSLFVSTVVDLSESEHIGYRWDVWFRKDATIHTNRECWYWNTAGRRPY